MAKAKPHWVDIEWGSETTREDNPDSACHYAFSTEAEMNAFLHGVEQACGWMDNCIVKASESYKVAVQE